MLSRVWRRVLEALEAGEAPTWLRESREALARRTLHAETARLEPTDEAREFVTNLGPGVAQDFGRAVLAHVEDGEPLPAVPPGLPARRAWEVRMLAEQLSTRHRFRL